MFKIEEDYLESLLSLEMDNNDNPEYVALHTDANSLKLHSTTQLPYSEIDEPTEIAQPPVIIYPPNYINSLTNKIKTTDDYILQFYFGSITIVVLLLYFRMLQNSK